jgi:spore coat polysaccharide biosynthesis predicted glycosyltransferase SpsG
VTSDPLVRVVVSAGMTTGRGHLSRGISLAAALTAADARVELIVVEGAATEAEARRLGDAGVVLLEAESARRRRSTASVTVIDLPDPKPPTDLYDVESDGHLVVFDDRSTFTGTASIVVQPSSPTWTGPGTAGQILSGYEYVPIGEAFRELVASPPRADRTGDGTPTVLVCFGGSDPAGVTERIAPVLAAERAWDTQVIIGPGHRSGVGRTAATWIRDPDDLPRRFALADLAVVAAGTLKFEAACLGLPAILVAAADDQLDVGPQFAATGAAIWAGDGRTVDSVVVRDLVRDLLGDPRRLRALGRRAKDVVDGHGAPRLADAILRLASRPS